MNGITRETFKEADEKTRIDILFDFQKDTSDNIKTIMDLLQQHPTDCDSRFKKLENMKYKNTGIAAGLGLIGGFSAMILKLKFWE